MHCDFLGSDRLQETHMDALKSFNSKYITLTMSAGFFTKFATLAHGVPCRLALKAYFIADILTKDAFLCRAFSFCL